MNQYVIGSPLFKKATIHLENGKTFQISAPNNSKENFYIQSATLNSKAYNNTIADKETKRLNELIPLHCKRYLSIKGSKIRCLL